MRRVYKILCPAAISASIMAVNMWKNSLKNVESDNNKILYETLLDFFYSEIYCLNKLLTTNAVRIKYVAKNQNVFHVLVGRFSFFL